MFTFSGDNYNYLTDEVDGLINGTTVHEVVFDEGGIYRGLTKHFFFEHLHERMN